MSDAGQNAGVAYIHDYSSILLGWNSAASTWNCWGLEQRASEPNQLIQALGWWQTCSCCFPGRVGKSSLMSLARTFET